MTNQSHYLEAYDISNGWTTGVSTGWICLGVRLALGLAMYTKKGAITQMTIIIIIIIIIITITITITIIIKKGGEEARNWLQPNFTELEMVVYSPPRQIK